MSVQKFTAVLPQAKFGKADQQYFPKWLRRYASHLKSVEGDLEVSQESVIAFCQALLKNQSPAWQRLQSVRAIEAYQQLVLNTNTPSLVEIKRTLTHIAAKERSTGSSATELDDPRRLVGVINPDEPEIIQKMRIELRLQHKKLKTERAYIKCVRQFFNFCGTHDVSQLAEPQIREFLTHKAIDANVAPNTQNQHKSALLFLFQKVLGRQLEFLDFVPADKAKRLPVVLSRPEIARLMPEFVDVKRLMFLLMYGAGLRHGECYRLRIKDVCFDEGHIRVFICVSATLLGRGGRGSCHDNILCRPKCFGGSLNLPNTSSFIYSPKTGR